MSVIFTSREKEKDTIQKPETKLPEQTENKPAHAEAEQEKPDTTRKSPETEKVDKTENVERDRSPVRVESAEANSTCG